MAAVSHLDNLNSAQKRAVTYGEPVGENGWRAGPLLIVAGAGTGKTSVSRYLNGETNVLSLDLRERIEAAIKRLDYQPNQMARGLKRGRNRLIGMLVADLTNPYTVEVLQGVEAACQALGYMPLICHAANEVEMERRYLQLLTTYRVEGVIVKGSGHWLIDEAPDQVIPRLMNFLSQ